MEDHLNNITTTIETYNNLSAPDAVSVSGLLKELSSELFYLEKHRADYFNKHAAIMFEEQSSAAKAKIKADHEVPEIYLLRRIMNAAYRVCDSMRSTISSLNKEK